jgi:hypothetical protein
MALGQCLWWRLSNINNPSFGEGIEERLGLKCRLQANGIFQIGPYCALQAWPVVDTCGSLVNDWCEPLMPSLIATYLLAGLLIVGSEFATSMTRLLFSF